MSSDPRLRILSEKPIDESRDYVLYWMQQSQRSHQNLALDLAIRKANQLQKPLVVCFGLMDDYPEATERHYAFMLEGLRDVARGLAERGARFVVDRMSPPESAIRRAKRAACVVCDRGYLRHLRRWRDEVADAIDTKLVEVDADVVVPIEAASTKMEIGARTLRPKIHKQQEAFLERVPETKLKVDASSLSIEPGDVDVSDVESMLAGIRTDRAVKRSPTFVGGRVEALRRLERFVAEKLKGYSTGRNEPADGQSSTLAPYLQYGQISPVEIALAGRAAEHAPREDRDTLLEELIVRRELSHNYCMHNPRYDSFDGLPGWAIASLEKHAADPRPIQYTREQLAAGDTHDAYWNAAHMEMVLTGFMHNYMRMYWGKKVLEWTANPRRAYADLLWLNNRYFLCGLNANSYGNVAWIFGQHDRPWGPERPIFGLIRYMNAGGLERKFDIDRYVASIDDLSRHLTGRGIRTS